MIVSNATLRRRRIVAAITRLFANPFDKRPTTLVGVFCACGQLLSILIGLFVILCCFVTYCYGKQPAPSCVQQPAAAHAAPQHSAASSADSSSPIHVTADGVTVHFTECRANEKQHVSCKLDMGDGGSRWVYIPTLTPQQVGL